MSTWLVTVDRAKPVASMSAALVIASSAATRRAIELSIVAVSVRATAGGPMSRSGGKAASAESI